MYWGLLGLQCILGYWVLKCLLGFWGLLDVLDHLDLRGVLGPFGLKGLLGHLGLFVPRCLKGLGHLKRFLNGLKGFQQY